MIKAKDFLKNANIYYSNNFIINPEISVILPTYCRGDNGLLERAMKSVLNQSFSNFELIVVDDGSVDKTREVVETLMENDNRIVYIRNDINSGLPAIRVNQGIKESRGKYIAYQFDDDQWYPNFLQCLYNEIIKKSGCCVVYGKADLFNMLNNRKDIFQFEPNRELLETRNIIANSSVLHHKELCEKYGMYDMHIFMKTGCDWDLWRRWINQVEFYFIDEFICKIESFHDNSIGKTCVYKKYLYDIVSENDRNTKLNLENYEEYEVDNVEFIKDEAMREIAYQHYVLPFLLRHRYIINKGIDYSLYSGAKSKKSILKESLKVEIHKIKSIVGQNGYICYVPHSGYLGGAENHLLRHAILSKKYGLNVVVFLKEECSRLENDVYKICKENNILVYYVNYDYYTTPNNIFEKLEDKYGENIFKLFKELDIRMVHSSTLIPSLKVAARELNIPYIASLYAVLEDTLNVSKDKKKKYMPDVVHSDSVIYANKWSEDIRTYSKCIRTWVPKYFFEYHKNIEFNKKRIKVIISGTLQDRKGQAEAIEAIGILKNEGIDMSLKIIGYDIFKDSYKNICIDMINKYSLQDRVELKGFVSDVSKEMEDGDILLCASTVESFPQVILEAMAKKLAIVSTPVGGVPEIIKDNFSGYLCNGYSSEDIAQGLRKAYYDYNKDKSKFKNIVEKAFHIVNSECSERRVAYELFLLYETTLRRNNKEVYETCIDIINYRIKPEELNNARDKGNNLEAAIEQQVEIINRYVPQNLGLKASKKIKNTKAYAINLNEKVKSISIYFGTHSVRAKGIMLISIRNMQRQLLVNKKYDLAIVEDNYEFIIELDNYIESNNKLIISFNLLYTDKNCEVSLYEKKENELYYEINNNI